MKKISKIQTQHVFVFCRVSTIDQEKEGVSLEMQKNQITKLLSSKGLKPTLFFEEQISGRKTSRPVFEEMRQKVLSTRKKDKDAKIVVAFWDITRMGRNVGYFATFLEEMKAAKAEVITLEEGRNIVSDEGFLPSMIRMVVAEEESRKTGARVRAAIEQVAHEGYVYFPHAPIGYDKALAENSNRKTLVKNKDAEAIRAVYMGFLHSDEPRTHLLNSKLPNVAKNTKYDIFSEFRLWLYAGKMPYPKADRYEDFTCFEGKHEGIITVDECRAIIEKQRRIARQENPEGFTHYSSDEHREIYWAKGLIVCPIDNLLYTSSTTRKPNQRLFHYYRSRTSGYSVPVARVDEIFVSCFKELRLDDDNFDALKREVENKVAHRLGKMQRERIAAEKDLEMFRQKEKALLDAWDKYPPELLEKISASISESIAATKKKLAAIDSNLYAVDNSMIYVLDLVQNLGDIFRLATADKKRDMVRAIFGTEPILDAKNGKVRTTYFNSVISVICCKSESYKTFEVVPSEKNPLGTVKGAYPDDFRTIAAFNPDDLKLLLALVA